ncbi:MAG: hypothetical protein ACLFPF_03235 [Halanaerobiales bacterium]
MKKHNTSTKIISFLNYKDILIILGSWYFMAAILLITRELTLEHSLLTHIFHFLFIVSGRFIYFSLMIFYLTSIYPVEFHHLGLNFHDFKKQLALGLSKTIALLILVLVFLNVPLSYADDIDIHAIYNIVGPESFISSLIPFLLIFFCCIFISLSEQFILNVVIFELFKYTIFNTFISVILTALLYSMIIANLTPSRILINFIAAIISILLYQRKHSIIPSTLFMAGYYSIYIAYVYGWSFIRF